MRIPKRMKQRPQWRGMAIPYIATIRDDGTPDFRVTDHVKRFEVMKWQMCQLCGQPLGRWCFFVGGPVSAEQNAYFEPACHLDCLMYAMQVCPFIVGTKSEHADLEAVRKANPDRTVLIDDTYVATNTETWVIVKANGWGYTQTKGGTIMIVPHVVKRSQVLRPKEMKPADWNQLTKELSSHDNTMQVNVHTA